MRLTLKIVLRNFKNRPMNYLINLFGLAISLSLIFMLAAYCYTELTADTHHLSGKDSYLLYNVPEQKQYGAIQPGILKEQIDLNIAGIKESLRLRQTWQPPVFKVRDKEPISSDLIYADENFFNFFTYNPVSGNLKDALAKPMSLVLVELEAIRLFGTAQVIGQTVMLNNKYPFTVTAVIEDPKAKSFLSLKAITSLSSIRYVQSDFSNEDFSNWQQRNFLIFIKLGARVSPTKTGDLITNLFPAERKEHTDIALCPLKDVYLNECGLNSPFLSLVETGNKGQIMILAMVAMLILVIALINYINISASQRNGLIKQKGIQKIVGANRFHISLGIIFESQLVFLMAAALAFLFAMGFSSAIGNYTGFKISSQLLWSPIFILGALTAVSILGLLASLPPSIRYYKFLSYYNIKSFTMPSNEKSLLRKSFVIFQFVTAIVLITFTMLVQKQIRFGSTDLGYQQDNILAVKINEQLLAKVDVLKDQLIKQPEVKHVSLARFYPGDVGINVNSGKLTMTNGEQKYFAINSMDADAQFFEIMEIKSVAGRLFTEDLSTESNKIVVNETFIKENELTDPIGTKAFFGNKDYEIVGVVKDFHVNPVNKPLIPLIILNRKPTHLFFSAYCLVKFSTADFSSLNRIVEKITDIGKLYSPDFPFEVKFMDQGVEAMYKSELQFRRIFSLFSGLAIFICCLGIFALSLSDSQRRTKEIGIRKVNGAKVSEILAMLNKDFIKWVAIAFIIATPVAYYVMQKWLENFAYKTNLSWWIFALAGLLALGIALLTVSWQSWKAATRNPVEALRYE